MTIDVAGHPDHTVDLNPNYSKRHKTRSMMYGYLSRLTSTSFGGRSRKLASSCKAKSTVDGTSYQSHAHSSYC